MHFLKFRFTSEKSRGADTWFPPLLVPIFTVQEAFLYGTCSSLSINNSTEQSLPWEASSRSDKQEIAHRRLHYKVRRLTHIVSKCVKIWKSGATIVNKYILFFFLLLWIGYNFFQYRSNCTWSSDVSSSSWTKIQTDFDKNNFYFKILYYPLCNRN
jgi:hypothetical protein